jgi:hypothetical protein
MSSIRLFWVLAFVSIAALIPVSAYTVSFMVVETGLPAGQGMVAYSNSWESGLLDAFFDAGHIVSNAPILRLDTPSSKRLPDEAVEGFDEANAGGADYFVLALLDFEDSESADLKPRQISLRVFKTSPFRFIKEEKFADTKTGKVEEDFISAKRAAVKILPYLD